MDTMTVAALHRYPVKSMLGEELTEGLLQAGGLLGDRGYALVDAADGTVASGKHPRKWGGLLQWSARYVDDPAPDRPLPPVELTGPDGTRVRSDDPAVHGVLSRATGRDVRLACDPLAGGAFEEVWPAVEGLAPAQFVTANTSDREAGGEPVTRLALGMLAPAPTYQDLAVLHLMTTSTLAALSRLAPAADFDVRRYRPNVVVAGAAAGFAEDAWVGTDLALGAAGVGVTMLTMRCVMTTLAQAGMAADPETLRTIAREHRREIPGLGVWACAGVYADVTGPGLVRVGDAVTA